MLYLIWSIVNALIIFLFFFLIIRFIRYRKKIFKSKFKLFSITIIVIGIASFISNYNSHKSKKNNIIISKVFNRDNPTIMRDIELDQNSIFNINMDVKYSIEKNKLVPIEASSFLTGFLSGHTWEFLSIEISEHKISEKSEFVASGILKWNLIGINIFSQSKTFKGEIN